MVGGAEHLLLCIPAMSVTNTDLGLAGALPVCKVYLALYESSQEVTIMVTNEA